MFIIVYICRPVYIESCACVVKDAVKCNFECLSVVYHTCRKHTLGVSDGEIIKLQRVLWTSFPWSKKSPTLKKFGHRFPCNLHFLRHPLPNYPGLFKDMGKKEVRRKGGWGALAHNDYMSLD